jgi:DNA repair exonuclease SbcCD ATPase subunit
MFNKKRIEELEQTLSDTNEKNNKDISALKSQINELKESLDKILDTLESKNFSKDWEEYQKWKEMKDKLPDIEEMFHLKELKRLIEDREQYLILKEKVTFEVIDFETKYGNVMQAPDRGGGSLVVMGKTNPRDGLNTILNQINIIDSQIQSILNKLRKKKSNKDLVGLLKLYAISTKWLQP